MLTISVKAHRSQTVDSTSTYIGTVPHPSGSRYDVPCSATAAVIVKWTASYSSATAGQSGRMPYRPELVGPRCGRWIRLDDRRVASPQLPVDGKTTAGAGQGPVGIPEHRRPPKESVDPVRRVRDVLDDGIGAGVDIGVASDQLSEGRQKVIVLHLDRVTQSIQAPHRDVVWHRTYAVDKPQVTPLVGLVL